MSISLKNIDDRVKTLESKVTQSSSYLLDYSKTVKIANGTKTYTAPSNGIVNVGICADKWAGPVRINNINVDTVYNVNGDWTEGACNMSYMLGKGETISFINAPVWGDYITMFFIPAKTLYYKVLEITASFIKEVLL